MFRKLSQALAIHGFASFRKDSHGFTNGLSQPFAKDSQVLKSWFFSRIRNGHFADVGYLRVNAGFKLIWTLITGQLVLPNFLKAGEIQPV